MLFNSATYLFLFLPLVCLLYWLSPLRGRLWIVFLASIVFYGFWRFEFVPLLLFSAVLDYVLALKIAGEARPHRRRLLMRVSVVANLAILGFFKYLIFFRDSFGSLAAILGYQPSFVELNIILPLGISFYIFQTMCYTIDVYRREFEPERDLLTYMCYVTFFPQLVAGPILRAADLIPQLRERLPFDSAKVIAGLERIAGGLFLKVVLADTVASFVDRGFEREVHTLSALDAWTLSFLFGFQIYFDFAGYSHIAIGSALLMGFVLPENFNFPYAATSPRDFWRRWHISLSTWIRDYLYLPIIRSYRPHRAAAWDTLAEVGETQSLVRRTWGLYATWAIMGLWHGANWTFVVWGLYHAVMVHAHRVLSPMVKWPSGALGWILGVAIALPVMMAGWIPFRAQSVTDALTLWGKLLSPNQYGALTLQPNAYFVAATLVIAVTARFAWSEFARERLHAWPVARFGLSAGFHAVTLAFVFLFLQDKQQFIYFQF